MTALAALTDDQLLADLQALEGQQRAQLARILAYLGEVDERRLHLRLGYSSLFRYCADVLGLSEDEAYRRIAVARLGRRYPEILPDIASGEMTLTGAALLKPHLNDENRAELFALARRASRRVIEEQPAARFPRPDVADSVSLTTARVEPRARIAPLSAERFHLQVTIGRETKRKLERALDLMSHVNPERGFERPLSRALDLLVAALEREKRAASGKDRGTAAKPTAAGGSRSAEAGTGEATDPTPTGLAAVATATGVAAVAKGAKEQTRKPREAGTLRARFGGPSSSETARPAPS